MQISDKERILQKLGVVLWKHRSQYKTAIEDDPWPLLEQQVSLCQKCALYQGRTQTVFGVGDQKAKLMLIGEGPGQEEDLQGIPFVGKAGQLLTNMLFAIGLTRDQVYIANIVKCRPPKNRNPTPTESLACLPYLKKQIILIEPKLIILLGKVPVRYILDSEESMGQLRQEKHFIELENKRFTVMATYHPAYLLRNAKEKAKTWQDLIFVKHYLDSV